MGLRCPQRFQDRLRLQTLPHRWSVDPHQGSLEIAVRLDPRLHPLHEPPSRIETPRQLLVEARRERGRLPGEAHGEAVSKGRAGHQRGEGAGAAGRAALDR